MWVATDSIKLYCVETGLPNENKRSTHNKLFFQSKNIEELHEVVALITNFASIQYVKNIRTYLKLRDFTSLIVKLISNSYLCSPIASFSRFSSMSKYRALFQSITFLCEKRKKRMEQSHNNGF